MKRTRSTRYGLAGETHPWNATGRRGGCEVRWLILARRLSKGYLGTGGIHFAAAARNARFPGSVPSLWLLDGSQNRVSSIPIPPLALPPVIRDLKSPREPALPARVPTRPRAVPPPQVTPYFAVAFAMVVKVIAV